jgi:beta-lactam-binding protein with PASTA domain
MDLLTLFAASPQPLLSLQEPFMYEFSTEPQGTILQQNPEPGTPVSGPTELEFVVSRGPEHRTLTVPALTGLTVAEAVEQLGKSKVNFVFSQRAPGKTETGGIVLSQEPAAETSVESNQAVSILVSSPVDMKSGEVFGLFTYTLPENPYPLPVKLEALLPDGGDRQLVLELDFIGGAFTYPYQLPAGSTLILSMLHREFYREAIRTPLDELSLDQL